MTYEEAGLRLGIKADSVRRRAASRKWPKRMGNDGYARVGVPVAAIPAANFPITGAITPDESGVEAAVLRAENKMLLERVDELKAERDTWRRIAEEALKPRPSWLGRLLQRPKA